MTTMVKIGGRMDEVDALRAENAALKKRVSELELVASLSKEVMDMDAIAMDRLAELAFSK